MACPNYARVNNLAETPEEVEAETGSDTLGHKKAERLVHTL